MLRTALSATALATTAVIAAAVPAHAAKLVLTDPAGDVWGGTEAPAQIGTRVNGDLVKTTVTHTARKVLVKAKYTDLAKNQDMLHFAYLVRTNENVKRIAAVTAWPGKRKGISEFSRPRGKAACNGMTHAIDYVADTVTISVPRTCLSNPRWVQIQAAGGTVNGDLYTIDDAQSTDAEPHAWSAKVRRG
jgi:hypothetical protein